MRHHRWSPPLASEVAKSGAGAEKQIFSPERRETMCSKMFFERELVSFDHEKVLLVKVCI